MTDSAPPRIPVASPVLGEAEARNVAECLQSTWISSAGRFIGEFETRFAEFCGVRHAVATNNGTTALHLALAALDIGPGDEVIVPDLTYIASANCVRYCGAEPVFVDCDPRTFNMDPERLEALVTPRTKAVVPVHLYGQPCDMDPIAAVAERHGLHLVEDAAEAHGARYRGRRTGGLGRCASFSFFGNKIITTGEGGAVTTDDDALAARLRLLRGQGMDPQRRYWFPVVGYNYRMTNVAAAIGVGQMDRIEEALAFRRKLAGWYGEALAGEPRVVRPHVEPWAEPSWWMYTVMLAPALTAARAGARDAVMAAMDAAGVETRPVFHPMHALPPYARDGAPFPHATDCAGRGINLPTHEKLTREDVGRVCAALCRSARSAGLSRPRWSQVRTSTSRSSLRRRVGASTSDQSIPAVAEALFRSDKRDEAGTPPGVPDATRATSSTSRTSPPALSCAHENGGSREAPAVPQS